MKVNDPKPLTIVIGADTFAPEINGAATFADALAGGLARRGHDVHVVAPATGSGRQGTFAEEHGGAVVTVHRLTSWRWKPHPWLRFALPWRVQTSSARVLDSVKPDVVHVQSNMIVGRGLSEQALKRNVRVVATNHAMPENLLEFAPIPHFAQKFAVRMWWRDADRVFSRAEVMTSPTRRAADFVQENTRIKKVLAISCGLDASKYSPNFEERIGNLIVFVGRVTGEKQIDKLISAFAMLEPSLEARLEIIGGGELEDGLKDLAATLGVADRVQFDGYVTDEFLRAALSRATVFAMPSIAELQSIATMEALASGLPVVAVRAMALPHLVHHGENGYLCEPGDIAAFAARLTDILSMPEEELQAFKRESLQIVQAHDLNHTIATFEQIYRGKTITQPLVEELLPAHHFIRERIVRARKRFQSLSRLRPRSARRSTGAM